MNSLNPLTIQKRKVEALSQLVAFACGKRKVSPEGFTQLLVEINGAAVTVAPQKLDQPQLETLRQWLHDGFARVADGQRWTISHVDAGEFEVDLSHGRTIIVQSVQALLALALLHVLDACEAWRIKRCGYPPCGKLFTAHKAGAFCSLSCGQAVRQLRKFDHKRARRLGLVAGTQMKQERLGEDLFLAECPRGLDDEQHLVDGREHRMTSTGRIVCGAPSTETAELPFTRGQILWNEAREQKRARHIRKAEAVLEKNRKVAS